MGSIFFNFTFHIGPCEDFKAHLGSVTCVQTDMNQLKSLYTKTACTTNRPVSKLFQSFLISFPWSGE